MTMPRSCRLDLATPPEVALRAAHAAIEAMPDDTRLTNAGLKVQEALRLVSAYVDEQMRGVVLEDDTSLSPTGWRNVAEEYAKRLREAGLVPYEFTRK